MILHSKSYLTEKIWLITGCLLAFVLGLLPSGGVYNLNIKILFFLLLLVLSITVYLQNKSIKIISSLIVGTCLVSFFGVWWIYGILRDNIWANEQFQGFFSTIFTIVVLYSSKYINQEFPKNIVKYIIIGNIVYCAVKIFLIFLIYFNYLSFESLLNIFSVIETTPITLEIIPRLIRIQTITDSITPFAIAYIIFNKKSRYYIILPLMYISLFLSYSRFLWIIAILVFILWFFRNASRIKKLTFVILSIIFFVFTPLNSKIGIIVDRFGGDETYQSDSTRRDQIQGLFSSVEINPLMGLGMGGYIREIIRDKNAPYSYEVQWLAFLMQFGVLGIILLISLVIVLLTLIYKNNGEVIWVVMYFLWILSGFTNPYLVSSTSAAVFIICVYGNKKRSGLNKESSL